MVGIAHHDGQEVGDAHPTGSDGGGKEQTVGVIFGPQHGAVTAAMIEKFIKPARRRYDALVVAGFAFSAEAQQIAAEPDLKDFPIHIANIAPPTEHPNYRYGRIREPIRRFDQSYGNGISA